MHHMVQLFFANKYEYANENSANATEQCATNQINNLSDNILIFWNICMDKVCRVKSSNFLKQQ